VRFIFLEQDLSLSVTINDRNLATFTAPDEFSRLKEQGEASLLLQADPGSENSPASLALHNLRLTSRFYAEDPVSMGAVPPARPGERLYTYAGTPQLIVDELRSLEIVPRAAGGIQAQAAEAYIFTSDLGFSAYPMLGPNPYQDYVFGYTAALQQGAPDTACGVIFRQEDGAHFATALYTPGGEVYFLEYQAGEPAPGGLAERTPLVQPGLNQPNTFVIVALGDQGSLFVNGRLAGRIPLNPVEGTFAVHIVLKTPEVAYCRLTNVWLWTLGR
jgi:hypothetical protein